MYFNEIDKNEKRYGQTDDRITKCKLRIQELMHISKEQAFTEYLQYMQNSIYDAENRVLFLSADLEKQYQAYQKNMQKQAAREIPVPAESVQTQPAQPVLTAPAVAEEVQHVQTPQPKAVSQHTAPRNMEFAVGAAVLSIVGSAFVLTAMVLLGMYFLQGIFKGIMLYLVSILVMLLSELLLYRKLPKLGVLFSAIGMAGLYVSTIVNYFALGSFHEWGAMGVTTLITVVVILLSRRRDAVFYRILGMVSMYCCFFVALWEKNNVDDLQPLQLAAVSVMVLLIHIMCMAVPVRRARTAMDIVQLALNSLFVVTVCREFIGVEKQIPEAFSNVWSYLLFLAVGVLVTQILYVVQVRFRVKTISGTAEQGTNAIEQNIGICIAYGISVFIYLMLFHEAVTTLFPVSAGELQWQQCRIGCICIAGLSLIPMLGLVKRQEKWFAWYFLCATALDLFVLPMENWEEIIWVLSVLLIVNRLAGLSKAPMAQGCDAFITAVSCCFCAAAVTLNSVFVTIPLFVCILISVLLTRYWMSYYEVILTFTIAWYVAYHMLNQLQLPVFVGILLLGLLLFNNVRPWNEKNAVVFNLFALTGQAVCFLLLILPVYRNAPLTYLCMLIFGTATIAICFQKHYHLDFAGKHMVLPGFLTYMALVVRMGNSVINSIVLMCIALGCVGTGFSMKKKGLRVYGLVLSLFTCAKLVLYDFSGTGTVMRTIMFFVVGVLALIIASIYIVLERNQGKKEAGI